MYSAGVAEDPEPSAEAPVRGSGVRGAVYGLHRPPVVDAREDRRREGQKNRHHGQGQHLPETTTTRGKRPTTR